MKRIKFDIQFVYILGAGILVDHKDKEFYIMLPGIVIEIVILKKKKKNTYKS